MELLAPLLICVFMAACVMPWINHGRLNARKRELDQLKDEVQRLSNKLLDPANPELTTRKPPPEVTAITEADIITEAEKTPTQATPPSLPPAAAETIAHARDASKKTQPSEPVATKQLTGIPLPKHDQATGDWFGKLAVWVGGIALLMAGFYMVKYSIESGLLTPAVRLWLTAIFGALLCSSGFIISLKSISAGNLRIGQALSGAGVACLYFALYAAVNMYGFLSSGAGFAGMVGVTALAVGLSLRHGAPIALIGLVGGFLTPMLMGNFREETASLFVYLFLLFGAAQFLCVKRGWWALFLGSLVAAYLWSGSLLVTYAGGLGGNPEGAMLFILGVCALNASLVLFVDVKVSAGRTRDLLVLIRLLAWSGGLLQALALVWLGGFGTIDMALFSVLSLGALALAVIREEEFAWGGYLAFTAILVSALANPEPQLLPFLAWPLGVSLVFFVVSHFKALRSERPMLWHGLALSSLISIVPTLFINREWLIVTSMPFEAFWLLLSLIAAGIILLAAEHLKRMVDSNKTTVAVYSACAFFLTGFGLWDYTPTRYLSAVVAGLLLAAALYWKLRQLARAQDVLGILAAAWLVSMFERIALTGNYLFHFVAIRNLDTHWSSLASWYFGVAALALVWTWFGASSSHSLRKAFSWILGLTTLLTIVASYQLIDITWMPERWSALSIEGGLTSLLAVLALLGLLAATCSRLSLSACWLLSSLMAYRIVFMHLLDGSAGGESFFWNALIWQFGVPFIAVAAMAWIMRAKDLASSCRVYQVAAMLLGFVWATFLVQDYFGGSRLIGPMDTNTEMYTYSVVWLVLAIIYQGVGLWRGIKTLHIGSLILLLLAIGKVFLVDASELEGLYRVLSFLGLGMALIGIGFFYNKVVFGRQIMDEASPDSAD